MKDFNYIDSGSVFFVLTFRLVFGKVLCLQFDFVQDVGCWIFWMIIGLLVSVEG